MVCKCFRNITQIWNTHVQSNIHFTGKNFNVLTIYSQLWVREPIIQSDIKQTLLLDLKACKKTSHNPCKWVLLRASIGGSSVTESWMFLALKWSMTCPKYAATQVQWQRRFFHRKSASYILLLKTIADQCMWLTVMSISTCELFSDCEKVEWWVIVFYGKCESFFTCTTMCILVGMYF